MWFSSCEEFLKFSRTADPNSPILRRMAESRDMVTKHTQEIHSVVLRPSLVKAVSNSPFWSVIVDESTDSATMEQLGVYVRFIDIEISEDFPPK